MKWGGDCNYGLTWVLSLMDIKNNKILVYFLKNIIAIYQRVRFCSIELIQSVNQKAEIFNKSNRKLMKVSLKRWYYTLTCLMNY